MAVPGGSEEILLDLGIRNASKLFPNSSLWKKKKYFTKYNFKILYLNYKKYAYIIF